MAAESLQQFAQELRSLREERGITLIQISNRTKIDIKFLQAIEEGKFDILPELYIRAFIKEFCQTIDVNAKQFIDRFDSIKNGRDENTVKVNSTKEIPAPVKSNVAEEKIPQQDVKEFDSTVSQFDPSIDDRPKKQIKLNYILGGIVLLIALIVFYFAFIQKSSEIIMVESSTETAQTEKVRFEVDDTTKNSQLVKAETAEKQIQKEEAQGIVENISKPKAASDSLQLSVHVNARVWVKIYVDGKVVYQELVDKGAKLSYRAKNKFSVSVGDVGAVKIFYNNKQVPNIGKTGESKNIYMAPDGIRYYTITGNEKKSSSKN